MRGLLRLKAIFSYCINARTVCLLAFACASIAVAACCIIWLFAKLLVSVAKSVSCILPRADDRLTDILSKFAIVDDSLLDNAPSSPRRVEINEIAAFKVALETLKPPHTHRTTSSPTYGTADRRLVITVAAQKDI